MCQKDQRGQNLFLKKEVHNLIPLNELLEKGPVVTNPNHPFYNNYANSVSAEEHTIMEDWEEHMTDFVPADMITFNIDSLDVEVPPPFNTIFFNFDLRFSTSI